jgi:hypothetical protein
MRGAVGALAALGTCVAGLPGASGPAATQTWPSNPIRIVGPFRVSSQVIDRSGQIALPEGPNGPLIPEIHQNEDWAEIYAKIFPSYQLSIESYMKARQLKADHSDSTRHGRIRSRHRSQCGVRNMHRPARDKSSRVAL